MMPKAQNRTEGSSCRAAFEEERAAAGGEPLPEAIGNVQNAVVSFTRVETFSTFLAEYAFRSGDIVVHFFLTRELAQKPERIRTQYFRELFPRVLSDTAEAYFDATRPRLSAEYIPEMTSWYFVARGFAHGLDPGAFVLRFLSRLDAELRAACAPAPANSGS